MVRNFATFGGAFAFSGSTFGAIKRRCIVSKVCMFGNGVLVTLPFHSLKNRDFQYTLHLSKYRYLFEMNQFTFSPKQSQRHCRGRSRCKRNGTRPSSRKIFPRHKPRKDSLQWKTIPREPFGILQYLQVQILLIQPNNIKLVKYTAVPSIQLTFVRTSWRSSFIISETSFAISIQG